jgi:hypothetical protein
MAYGNGFGITEDTLIGLTKQALIYEQLFNGLFPCRSDIVRLLRLKKRAWTFTDQFEYRMMLAGTNRVGTLNGQLFQENVKLLMPGKTQYGQYFASYGSVSSGFNVDMMVNLETANAKTSFDRDYNVSMYNLKRDVTNGFKNFAISGQYGVVHQLRASIGVPDVDTVLNPRPNTGFTPTIGEPFTLAVPCNVSNDGFKHGSFFIKTITNPTTPTIPYAWTGGNAPWGPAQTAEMYYVLDSQPGVLHIVPVGTAVTPWQDGEFLELAFNRETSDGTKFTQANFTGNIVINSTTTGGPSPYNNQVVPKFTPTNLPPYYSYGGGASGQGGAIVGAMEGLADMFPWYHDPAATGNYISRLGLDMPYRGQTNRFLNSTEQAGGWVVQQEGENIMDAIMRGTFLTKQTVPWEDVGIWLNPIVRTQIGYEEGEAVKVIRDNFVAGPIIYQRGIQKCQYTIGTQVVNEIIEDFNLPTDVIVIGPKQDISYNCFDNAMVDIDAFVQDTWAKQPDLKPENVQLPQEFVSKLDISGRIAIGPPSLGDGAVARYAGANIRHPQNVVNVAMHEMGALFTEYPYTYTIVKLREPILGIST